MYPSNDIIIIRAEFSKIVSILTTIEFLLEAIAQVDITDIFKSMNTCMWPSTAIKTQLKIEVTVALRPAVQINLS
jgi:hypothetical protein